MTTLRFLAPFKNFLSVTALGTGLLLAAPAHAVPQVTWYNPANNDKFTPPATIAINVGASDSSGAISKVEIFRGGTILIASIVTGQAGNTGSTYAYNWVNPPTGAYSLTAVATNTLGQTATTPARAITVNSPPTIAFTAPANGTVYYAYATIPMTVNAADADGTVTQVQYFSGNTLIGTSTTPPFSFTWTNAAPPYATLTAKATDNLGAVTTSASITVTINNPVYVGLVSPLNNAKYSSPGTVAFTATAYTQSCGSCMAPVTKVDYYAGPAANNLTLIGTGTTPPDYAFTWTNVATGKYVVKPIATDSQGLTATNSTTTITVNNPPTVSIGSPVSGSTAAVGSNVTMTATATDADGTVAKVDFLNGSTTLGTVTTGQSGNTGSSYTFTLTNVQAGTLSLKAKATDNLSGTTTSSPAVTVTISGSLTSQTITGFAPTTPITLQAAPNNTVTLSATGGGSGNPVVFASSTSPICTVAGNVVTVLAVGTCTLTANQAGNASYSAAAQVTASVVVNTAVRQVYYVHADHLGTPRAITRPSDNQVVWKWENSDPFGANAPNEDPANTGTTFKYNLRFPGQYYDQETGTFYNYFRTTIRARGDTFRAIRLG